MSAERLTAAKAPAEHASAADLGAASRRRARARAHGGPPQDHATYTCGCGYLFDAAVSTSVQCPHCGAPQAW